MSLDKFEKMLYNAVGVSYETVVVKAEVKII